MTLAVEPIPEDVVEFFGGAMLLGYVATARPDRDLAIVPMGVVIHEGVIRISTPADTFKVRNLKQDPHISVCLPYPEDARRYLMIRGSAEIAEDRDRQFIDWIVRTHMGLEEHPHEAADAERMVITLRPTRFLLSGAQGVV
ncbi:MAG: pyridoxamine 5'-phosphate oxidase family protein [Novosphingobium sp.]|nr:pyridoxamine 5'-phosphate oxidase family protein [Novosphingobium sp.]